MIGHPISLVLTGLGAYLIGAIPFSFLIPKFFAGKDIREYSSGNPGASNVTRVCGKLYGLTALLFDVGKGVLALFVVTKLGFPQALGTLAILGHITTPFLNFSGGKGVATTLGGIFFISWPGGLIFSAVWAISLLIWNYAGLSSLLAIITVPVSFYFLNLSDMLFWTSLGLVVLIFFTHRSNIERIIQGGENTI